MIKQIVILLLTFQLSFAQNNDKSISVVSAERMNIVYRGISNAIKIAVPGAKSFTATAPGLVKTDSLGNYKLSPGSGNEVIINIEAQMEDGFVLREEKRFRVKGIPSLTGVVVINSHDHCSQCYLSKTTIKNTYVSLICENFMFYDSEKDFGVKSFIITVSKQGNKNQTFQIDGNTLPRHLVDKIENLEKEIY